jgi:hypothetical protein
MQSAIGLTGVQPELLLKEFLNSKRLAPSLSETGGWRNLGLLWSVFPGVFDIILIFQAIIG